MSAIKNHFEEQISNGIKQSNDSADLDLSYQEYLENEQFQRDVEQSESENIFRLTNTYPH